MQKTQNYLLSKPGYEDPIDIEVINQNMDAIDGELARKAEGEAADISIVSNSKILSLFEEGGH